MDRAKGNLAALKGAGLVAGDIDIDEVLKNTEFLDAKGIRERYCNGTVIAANNIFTDINFIKKNDKYALSETDSSNLPHLNIWCEELFILKTSSFDLSGEDYGGEARPAEAEDKPAAEGSQGYPGGNITIEFTNIRSLNAAKLLLNVSGGQGQKGGHGFSPEGLREVDKGDDGIADEPHIYHYSCSPPKCIGVIAGKAPTGGKQGPKGGDGARGGVGGHAGHITLKVSADFDEQNLTIDCISNAGKGGRGGDVGKGGAGGRPGKTAVKLKCTFLGGPQLVSAICEPDGHYPEAAQGPQGDDGKPGDDGKDGVSAPVKIIERCSPSSPTTLFSFNNSGN